MDSLIEICRTVRIEASARQLTSLGNAGGFSGARFWRISTDAGDWCVRCWPRGTTRDRVDWIHAIIRSIAKEVDVLAVARKTSDGQSSFEATNRELGRRVYEITPWLSGVADYWTSSSEDRQYKLNAAMRMLAAFHQAAATVEVNGQRYRSETTSAGLETRYQRCQELLAGKLQRIADAACSDRRDFVRESAPCLIDGFRSAADGLRTRLQELSSVTWHQQLCLRDIWHDHLLFDGKEVSGIVDYDAIRVESPVGDVARLLGSLVGCANDSDSNLASDRLGESFRNGLHAYESVRPLSDRERALLSVWDASNAAMAGLQWLEWLCLERRKFEDEVSVKDRLMQHVGRLSVWHGPC